MNSIKERAFKDNLRSVLAGYVKNEGMQAFQAPCYLHWEAWGDRRADGNWVVDYGTPSSEEVCYEVQLTTEELCRRMQDWWEAAGEEGRFEEQTAATKAKETVEFFKEIHIGEVVGRMAKEMCFD